MSFSSEDLKRFRSYEKVHLKGVDENLPPSAKIELLQKKDRNKWYMLVFNVLAILFFGYSFIFDVTTLSDTIFTILLVVFAINVGLIFLQKKQISELIRFYQSI
jgi:hypothetical protein